MDFGEPIDSGDPRRNVYLALEGLYCGCGNPEDAIELVHEVLKAAPFYDHRDRLEKLLPTTGIQMLVLGALDKAELIEHGGSIGGSWLTPRGEEALRGLDLIAREEGYEGFENIDRCAHGLPIDADCDECGGGLGRLVGIGRASLST